MPNSSVSHKWDSSQLGTVQACFASHPIRHPLLETEGASFKKISETAKDTGVDMGEHHHQPLVRWLPKQWLSIQTPRGDCWMFWGRNWSTHSPLGTIVPEVFIIVVSILCWFIVKYCEYIMWICLQISLNVGISKFFPWLLRVKLFSCHQRNDSIRAHKIDQMAWIGPWLSMVQDGSTTIVTEPHDPIHPWQRIQLTIRRESQSHAACRLLLASGIVDR